MARVLIVDDSLTVRMDLTEAFEDEGFETVACATLAQARAALAAGEFALAVLDVLLPDGDGIELLRELKPAGAPGVAVMMLTVEDEARDRLRGLARGADDYVGKPYDRAYVVARAHELVGDGAPGGAPLVLVVEDSRTYRASLTETLSAAGYRVRAAESGEEGLRVAAALRPDAIIIDQGLPGITGLTVIQRMRSDAALKHTPCLLLTASDDRADELAGLEAGADAYFRKGQDPVLVLARLGALVRSAGAAGRAADVPGALGPKRLIAVDNGGRYLRRLASELRRDGYDVIVVPTCDEAVSLLRAQVFDCVLFDAVVGDGVDLEICRRLKTADSSSTTPIIVFSAREDPGVVSGAFEAGADDVVAASSDFEVVRARLRAQLRRKNFVEETAAVREREVRRELAEAEAQSARELAAARAELNADLERKNTELIVARERAEQASRFKSRFLTGVSHELRTPLNAIIGFSELLEDGIGGPLADRQREYVGNILTSARHLLTIVNDVLDLAKVEAERLRFEPEHFDFDAALDRAAALMRPLAERAGVVLHVDVEAPPIQAYLDPGRVQQILYNLLSNAIQFTPAGGRVDLRSRREGEGVRLTVTDTGIGIAPENIGRLFHEFEQLSETAETRRTGTGLGLVLTKRLVELHGGRIAVESVRGAGTTFSVWLPLSVAAPTEGTPW